MIFVWGSGHGWAVVGDAGIAKCPSCSKQTAALRRFDLVVHYRYRHIWYLLNWVTNREYVKMCSVCHSTIGDKIVGPELAAMLEGKKNPIPIFRRWSWILAPAIFVGLLFFGIYLDAEDKKELAEHISAPKIGDVYLADLSKISNGFDTHPTYGAMKLVGMDGDTGHFVTAQKGYTEKRYARDDVSNGDVKKDSYYDSSETEDLTMEELSKLSKDGVVYQFVQ